MQALGTHKSRATKLVRINRRLALHPDVVYLWFHVAKVHDANHEKRLSEYLATRGVNFDGLDEHVKEKVRRSWLNV